MSKRRKRRNQSRGVCPVCAARAADEAPTPPTPVPPAPEPVEPPRPPELPKPKQPWGADSFRALLMQRYTVKQLKAKLRAKDIDFPTRARKAALVRLLVP